MTPQSGTRRFPSPLQLGAAVGGFFLCAIGLFMLHPPGEFAIFFLLLSFWFLGLAWCSRGRLLQNGLLVFAAVAFCALGGEIAAWILNWSSRPRIAGTLRETYDPDLGYHPLPDQHAAVELRLGSRRIFRATYTINDAGLRATPPTPTARCVAAFFSDSYSFGWGLPDDETMPALFVKATGGQYAAYNLSYNGYGPHQMLRAIETGRLDVAVGSRHVDLVIYEGIVNHLARAAGRVSWDPSGPKYALTGDGGVRYVGALRPALYRWLGGSQLFYLMDSAFLDTGRPTAGDLPLYIGILKQTRELLRRRYGAPLVTLFWDTDRDVGSELGANDGALARKTFHRLAEEGFAPIAISSVIPDIDSHRAAYALADDVHPNAEANGRIARYLAREIAPRHCDAMRYAAGSQTLVTNGSENHQNGP